MHGRVAARKWGKFKQEESGQCLFVYMIFFYPPHLIFFNFNFCAPRPTNFPLRLQPFSFTREMACMEEKALKSSFRRQLAAKSTQPVLWEDSCLLNGTSGVGGEDFAVEEFFNFSKEDLENWSSAEGEEAEYEEDLEKDRLSVSSTDRVDDDSNSNPTSFSATGDDDSLLSELAVPRDDLASLEWVSHFVDDSLLEFSLLQPPAETQPKIRSQSESRPIFSGVSCLSSPVPAKPRTKKARSSGRVWSGSLTDSSSSPSSSSSSSSGFLTTPSLPFTNIGQVTDFFPAKTEPPPAKKQKKKAEDEPGGLAKGTQVQRRCSHCQVQKTPQWRAGPLGAKTLCNACGVRYKSGRLFPEYRPACSPTFSGDIHSNSHRRVLELRKRKDIDGPVPGSGRMVQSF